MSDIYKSLRENIILQQQWIEKNFMQESDIEKARTKSVIGDIKVWADGSYRKVSETGNSNKDWQYIKGSGKPKPAAFEAEEKPKSVEDAAKYASEPALSNAIKTSSDPKVREAAHKELLRRKNEEQAEVLQPDNSKQKQEISGGDKKEEVKGVEENKEGKVEVKNNKNSFEPFKDFKTKKVGDTIKIMGKNSNDIKEVKLIKKEGSGKFFATVNLDGVEKEIYVSAIFNEGNYEAQIKRDRNNKFLEILKQKTGNGDVYNSIDDPDLEIIGSKGKLYKNVEKFQYLRDYKSGECHWNASKAYQKGVIDGIVIGFYKDARNVEWVQHTWGVKDGNQIEVTPGVDGEMYFGYELNEKETNNFVEDTTNRFKPGQGKIRAGKSNIHK